MSSVVAGFDVYSAEYGEKRRIELVDDIDSAALDFVEREWMPLLHAAKDRAQLAFLALPKAQRNRPAWDAKSAKFGAPDGHWDWRAKVGYVARSSTRLFCLLDQGSVEALMIADLTKKSLLSSSAAAEIVYVDYLAVAPWNRAQFQTPRFKGFGKIMLATAVSLSFDEELDGRCGLHSLVQSEGFYRRCGMTDGGIAPGNPLRYFEFEAASAKKFLET